MTQFRNEILQDNKVALDFLKLEKDRDCHDLLKKCEGRLVRRLKEYGGNRLNLKLLSVTLNNMACYYKKYSDLTQKKDVSNSSQIFGKSPSNRQIFFEKEEHHGHHVHEHQRHSVKHGQIQRVIQTVEEGQHHVS